MKNTPKEFGQFLWQCYKGGPLGTRILQSLRPYICPFDLLLQTVPTNSTLLDIGSGSGGFVFLVNRFRGLNQGVGVDVNEETISVARDAIKNLKKEEQKKLSFFTSEDEDSWSKKDFNVVSMIDVLHHVPPAQQDDFILKWYSHVSPGGLFIYKDMCTSPWYLELANRMHDLIFARQWVHHKRIKEVEDLLVKHNGVIVQKGSIRKLIYGHEYLIIQKKD